MDITPSEAKANPGIAGSSAMSERTTSRRGCIEVRPYKIRDAAAGPVSSPAFRFHCNNNRYFHEIKYLKYTDFIPETYRIYTFHPLRTITVTWFDQNLYTQSIAKVTYFNLLQPFLYLK